MTYIFCLMGKSAAGKDTIYRKLREMLKAPDSPDADIGTGETAARTSHLTVADVGEVVPYTTRPIRTGEENGVEYRFETGEQYEEAASAGRIIEARAYDTVHGIWRYYTKDDGQIDLDRRSYLVIGTLEAYLSYCKYFGAERVVPFYIEVEERERLRRALRREDQQANPHYTELCRRFLSDEEDFSEEKLAAAGITRRYRNTDSGDCAAEILREMERMLTGQGEDAPKAPSGDAPSGVASQLPSGADASQRS